MSNKERKIFSLGGSFKPSRTQLIILIIVAVLIIAGVIIYGKWTGDRRSAISEAIDENGNVITLDNLDEYVRSQE